MKPDTVLKKGDIVQLSPWRTESKSFAGCLMIVTVPQAYGAEGYIQNAGLSGEAGARLFYKAVWCEMEVCGEAYWDV